MVHGRRVSIGGYYILLICVEEMLWIRTLWVSKLLCFHVLLTEVAFAVVGAAQMFSVDSWDYGAGESMML